VVPATESLLLKALGLGNFDSAELLSKGGADVDVRNKHSPTPLHDSDAFDSGKSRHRPIAHQLWCKCKCYGQMPWGHSPLYHALQRQKPDVLELLVKDGADVSARGRGQ
jgi:hypothetical protein